MYILILFINYFLTFLYYLYLNSAEFFAIKAPTPPPPSPPPPAHTPPQRASARDRVRMVGPPTGGWTAASETEQKSFKCPPCCRWRTEPTVGSAASEKNSPRESDRDPGLHPPAPLATPFFIFQATTLRTFELEINRTEIIHESSTRHRCDYPEIR